MQNFRENIYRCFNRRLLRRRPAFGEPKDVAQVARLRLRAKQS